ncbi:hypothetical protein Hypma_016217 [Hypsizygus marmoreus]|uniref:Uncharacterized protein n=1 Tax=Hypsizygus marmoreus TaxID=39966 RepID=A0A369IYG1_HYPMA|nr:hypothetical protein Hypma_016217 [Hypsizygus marmoreus]
MSLTLTLERIQELPATFTVKAQGTDTSLSHGTAGNIAKSTAPRTKSQFPHVQNGYDYPLYFLATSNEKRDRKAYHLLKRLIALRDDLAKEELILTSIHDRLFKRTMTVTKTGSPSWGPAEAPYSPDRWSTSDMLELRTIEYEQLKRQRTISALEMSILGLEEEKALQRMRTFQRRAHADSPASFFSKLLIIPPVPDAPEVPKSDDRPEVETMC